MDEEPEFDPATRRLCPDGSCVGILGRDGRCVECGKTEDPLAAEADMELSDNGFEGVSPASASVDEGFDAGRALCADGTCVGVLAEDGKCNVCGRSAGT